LARGGPLTAHLSEELHDAIGWLHDEIPLTTCNAWTIGYRKDLREIERDYCRRLQQIEKKPGRTAFERVRKVLDYGLARLFRSGSAPAIRQAREFNDAPDLEDAEHRSVLYAATAAYHAAVFMAEEAATTLIVIGCDLQDPDLDLCLDHLNIEGVLTAPDLALKASAGYRTLWSWLDQAGRRNRRAPVLANLAPAEAALCAQNLAALASHGEGWLRDRRFLRIFRANVQSTHELVAGAKPFLKMSLGMLREYRMNVQTLRNLAYFSLQLREPEVLRDVACAASEFLGLSQDQLWTANLAGQRPLCSLASWLLPFAITSPSIGLQGEFQLGKPVILNV
jgi:hypothetical protein